jgi:hypothetical protein
MKPFYLAAALLLSHTAPAFAGYDELRERYLNDMEERAEQNEQSRATYAAQVVASQLPALLGRPGASVSSAYVKTRPGGGTVYEHTINGGEFICAERVSGMGSYEYIDCLNSAGASVLSFNDDELRQLRNGTYGVKRVSPKRLRKKR